MDCYNISLLEKLYNKYTKNGRIDNLIQWHDFIEFLYVNQLIDSDDMIRIKDSLIYFPLIFENLVKIFKNCNIIPPLQDISQELDKLNTQFHDCRETLKNWNYKTFSIDDMKYACKTYEEIEKEYCDFKNEFEEFAADVLIVNQPIQSLKSIVNSFPQIEINPTEYLSQNRDKIDKEYQKIRIKSVQYRNQAIKILKQGEIKVQVGYDQMKDSPIEVWLIPKCMWSQQEQCELLNTFEAHHELILSPYFPKYLGQNLLQDNNYYQHFMELKRGHTLKYLIKQQKKSIQPDSLFFQIAMRQIFGGLYDLLRMTRYMPILPITLQNIQVCNDGVQIILRNIRFSELREEDSIELEATLLENFAQIVMSSLDLKREDVGKLGKYLPWKNLLQGLFSAEEDHQLYKRGIIQNRLTFSQLLNHDLFDEEILSNYEVNDIVKSYHDWIA